MTDQANDKEQTEAEKLLAEITNAEGKPKYESTEAALNALKNTQEHIPTIEQENAKLRQEQEQATERLKKLEEMLNTLTKQTEQEESTATTEQESSKSGSDAVDMDALYTQLQNKFTEEAKAKQREANKVEALTALKTTFGEKAGEVLSAKAADLGVSEQWLLEQAAHSPKAFYNHVGLNSKPKQSGSTTQSSFNSSAFNNTKKEYTGKNPVLTGNSKDAIEFFQNYC